VLYWDLWKLFSQPSAVSHGINKVHIKIQILHFVLLLLVCWQHCAKKSLVAFVLAIHIFLIYLGGLLPSHVEIRIVCPNKTCSQLSTNSYGSGKRLPIAHIYQWQILMECNMYYNVYYSFLYCDSSLGSCMFCTIWLSNVPDVIFLQIFFWSHDFIKDKCYQQNQAGTKCTQKPLLHKWYL